MSKYATDKTVALDATDQILAIVDDLPPGFQSHDQVRKDIMSIVLKAISKARSAEVIPDGRG